MHLYDAGSGRLVATLPLDPPDDDEGIESLAVRGPYLVVGSASYAGDGRLWTFTP